MPGNGGGKSSRRGAELALVGVTFVWGSTFTLVKSAIEDASTPVFLAIRFTLAAILLAAIYRKRLAAGLTRDGLRGGLLAGFCLWAGYWLQTAGLRHTTPAKSAFLTSLCVVMVPILATLVHRVVPRRGESAGVLLAVTGMALLAAPETGAGTNRGDWMTVGAALAFAAHILVLGRFTPRAALGELSVLQIAAVAVFATLSIGWLETPFARWSGRLLVAVALTGMLCTAVAFTVQVWAQKHTTANRTALIFVLEPAFAWGTSWILTGETLTARGLLGAGFIVGGILTAELKPDPARAHPPS